MPVSRLIATALIALMATPSLAGTVTRENAAADFQWTSSECLRPVRPHLRQSDPRGQSHMQDYALKVALYLDCLKLEAQRDFDRAQVEMHEAIQRQLQAETDRMNDSVERMVRERPR